ncbi:MAG: IPTL-CTERM sorting domain-containing protein, partial [Betaproteobacteria bacterium]
NVTFTPTALGVRSGAVSVTSDAAGSPHSSALGGTGIPASSPAVSLTPPALAFGSQLVGTTSAAQALTLQNVGTATLNIASIVASGDFAQATTCGATLAPTLSCTINVTFTPTALGSRTGAISVASDAPGSPHASALSGTGAAVPPSGLVAQIPTLSEWALIALSLLVAMLALRSRRLSAVRRR